MLEHVINNALVSDLLHPFLCHGMQGIWFGYVVVCSAVQAISTTHAESTRYEILCDEIGRV